MENNFNNKDENKEELSKIRKALKEREEKIRETIGKNTEIEIIRGTFNFCIGRDHQTGWSVYQYRGDEEFRKKYGAKNFTLTGNNLPVLAIQHEFEAIYDIDKKGRSFQCVSYKECPKISKEDTMTWLCSPIFDGIGKKLAEKIVNKLGEDAFNLIKEDFYILKTAGLSEKKLEKAKRTFDIYYRGDLDILRFFNRHFGLTDVRTRMILDFYQKVLNIEPKDIIEYIKQYPYELYLKSKIDFQKVDQFALNNGVKFYDRDRIQSAIYEVLRVNEGKGNTYLDANSLVESVLRLLSLDWNYKKFIQEAVLEEIENESIVSYHKYLENGISFYRTAVNEMNLANFVLADNASPILKKSVNKFGRDLTKEELDGMLNEVINNNTPDGLVLDISQIEAIKTSLNNRFSIITGGPGTGKTTITNILVACYKELTNCQNNSICLVAPTGAAAKRMFEKSGHIAKTINSKFRLGINTDNGNGFMGMPNQEDIYIKNSLLILDEASMLDLERASAFLECVDKSSVNVIFVGDKDQLNSVGKGQIFYDLLSYFKEKELQNDLYKSPVSYLNVTHRQAEGSGIISIAHAINNGDYLAATVSNNEYSVIQVEKEGRDSESYLKHLENNLIETMKDAVDKYSLKDTIALCPQNEGVCGLHSVNKRLQDVFNPKKSEEDFTIKGTHGYEYRVGDRVVHLRNNEDLVNGDVGFVKEISEFNGIKYMTVLYNTVEKDVEYVYKKSNMDEVMLSYAQTVHKAQGSEYPCVVLCLTTEQPFAIRRNLFYTAITRGRYHDYVVGDRRAIIDATVSTLINKRYTRLLQILRIADRCEVNHIESIKDIKVNIQS